MAAPTGHGRAIAALPLPPRLAHMLIEAEARGWAPTAAEAAVLISERGLGGPEADLEIRLRRWRSDRGKRAQAARGLAKRWLALLAARAESLSHRRRVGFARRAASRSPFPTGCRSGAAATAATGSASADAASGSTRPRRWRARNGWRWRKSAARPPARASWPRRRSTRRWSRPCSPTASGRDRSPVRSRHRRGARLARPPAGRRPAFRRPRQPGRSRRGRGGSARGRAQHGLDLLPWSDAAAALRRRAAFARSFEPGLADLSDEALLAALDEWLPGLLAGRTRLADVEPEALSGTLDALLGWEGRKRVDRLAPSHFDSPAGSRHPIDYAAEAGPTVEVRAQALYGLTRHPPSPAARSADPRPHLARRPADPDHARPARLLARQLGFGRQGDARPLSAPSWPGRSRVRHPDAAQQESLGPALISARPPQRRSGSVNEGRGCYICSVRNRTCHL